jgi:hydrogenase maturation protein HypF
MVRGETNGATEAFSLAVRGTVQGVGFRPFVFRLALSCGVRGFVGNGPGGVLIRAEGTPGALRAFRARLAAEAPAAARIERIVARRVRPAGYAEFTVAQSRPDGETLACLPPDIAACPECLAELADPADRRHGYPFVNCTNCGPRFTIVSRLPYDRINTSMAPFPLCPECAREYADPADRRFHAEPVACPACGPALRAEAADGTPVDAPPVEAAAEALRRGAIVALRGLGGFQLACDAGDAGAVGRLRERKRREEKPFAVMVRDLPEARGLARLSAAEAALLADPAAPIVLCERAAGAPLVPGVSPGLSRIGLLLPYTPLHRLLCDAAARPLVMTSGNLTDEPIAVGNDEAKARLCCVADLFLLHDREVLRRADDSVAAVVEGKPYPVRRARGYAPAPVRLGGRHARLARALGDRAVAGLGGEMKGAFCFLKRGEAVLSQHLGDLGDPLARDFYRSEFDFFRRFLDADPAAACRDLHPGYFTTAFAESFAGSCPVFPLQHHEAHLYALLAERGFSGRAVGVAFDGTGYGHDGTVWGGEFFAIDGPSMRRAGRLRPFALQGGDAAVRAPWKSALSLLLAAMPAGEAEDAAVRLMPEVAPEAIALAADATRKGINTVGCSSAGRLFDGVSALCGLGGGGTFEGQAAMRLEAAAGRARGEAVPYPFSLRPESGLLAVFWDDAIAEIAADRLRGAATARIARRFHDTVAAMIVEAAARLAEAAGARTVLLSGGVFQNLALLRRLLPALRARKLSPVIHREVPCNDGGLALGQAFFAALKLEGRV